MPFSDDETRTILDELRRGATIVIGSSRSHTEYRHREGKWYREMFDEGASDESETSEANIRSAIEEAGEDLRDLVEKPLWRRVLAAWKQGDRARAIAALAEMGPRDRFGHVALLHAALAWPEERPSDEARAHLREIVERYTAYHAVMTAAEYSKSYAVGQLGVACCDTLTAIFGGVPDLSETRAVFAKMADGDA